MLTNPRRFVPSLALTLAVALPAVGWHGGDEHATKPAADEGLPQLDDIMKSVAEIRELEFKRPVVAEKQSIEDFGAFVEAELDAAFPKERRDGMQQGLMRLGLLLEPIDIGEALQNALLSQAAAYYDPQTGKFFYLMTDMPPMMLNPVAAHELVHALQDQHFDLKARTEALEESFGEWPRNEDRMLAFRFLIEGEATYVMRLWETSSMGMDLAADPQMEAAQFGMLANLETSQLVAMSKQMEGMIRQMLDLEEGEENPMVEAMAQLESIPPYILEPLYAAYMKGAFFAMKLRHHGGWAAIDAAYDGMPLSAEQTMHPEKYTDERDDPTTVVLPPLSESMASAWQTIDAAVLGEFYLRLLLTNFGCPSKDASRATAGWDGDVYHAYRDAGGRVMITLATTWDGEPDASEFYEAYRAILAKKYPGMKEHTTTADLQGGPDGPGEGEPTEMSVAYVCGDDAGAGMLARRGREVFAVEGGGIADVNRIMNELMSMDVDHVD